MSGCDDLKEGDWVQILADNYHEDDYNGLVGKHFRVFKDGDLWKFKSPRPMNYAHFLMIRDRYYDLGFFSYKKMTSRLWKLLR